MSVAPDNPSERWSVSICEKCGQHLTGSLEYSVGEYDLDGQWVGDLHSDQVETCGGRIRTVEVCPVSELVVALQERDHAISARETERAGYVSTLGRVAKERDALRGAWGDPLAKAEAEVVGLTNQLEAQRTAYRLCIEAATDRKLENRELKRKLEEKDEILRAVVRYADAELGRGEHLPDCVPGDHETMCSCGLDAIQSGEFEQHLDRVRAALSSEESDE